MTDETGRPSLIVRRATESDLGVIEAMIGEDVRGHSAEHHPRSRDALRQAYLGEKPVAYLYVAERDGAVIGMGQWQPLFDMFWGFFGGHAEWLFVRKEARGSGIAAAIIAQMCADVVASGGKFLRAGADSEEIASLYRRVANGWPAHQFYLSEKGLAAFGALAGKPVREIVRGLPDPGIEEDD